VYRGLDIGTAKVSPDVRRRIAHHLIDIRDPSETYSAGEFLADAMRLVREVRARGRTPLFVGGTMLYLRALRQGLARLPSASVELRRELDERGAREGWPALHAELARVDPVAAARIHPRDPQRIQRALEVYLLSGIPISSQQRAAPRAADSAFRVWALVPPRAVLHERIERRFRAMMAAGFLEEVRSLRARGDLSASSPSVRAVGYRQLWLHLDGADTLAAAVDRGLAATRQLAKRQLTWLRADETLSVLDPTADNSYQAWRAALVAGLPERGR
ncbi:MAG TPA: tRNA (adenosine(37)-N6)-dimethylallyltransferase MiaA, partial [Steroidobacteraceae bacterium]